MLTADSTKDLEKKMVYFLYQGLKEWAMAMWNSKMMETREREADKKVQPVVEVIVWAINGNMVLSKKSLNQAQHQLLFFILELSSNAFRNCQLRQRGHRTEPWMTSWAKTSSSSD